MKCIIASRVLTHRRVTGIERYVKSIIKVLESFEGFEWKVVKPKYSNRIYHIFWEHFILPRICNREKADILFCPDNISPAIIKPKNTKVVLTIHDVYWKEFKDKFFLGQKYYSFIVPRSIKNSDLIITISNYSKNMIIKYFSEAQEKIKVIYPGLDFSMLKSLNLVRKKQILYVGTLAKHKNLLGIVKAFSVIYKKIPHKLIIAGGSSILSFTKEPLLKDYIKRIPRDRIEFTGYVSDEEIIKLYNESDFFVFPSFYEGFGLPPLEAMACGCPVLVSNVASLPEVCGNAALYCDPYNIDDIAEKMLQLANDEELKEKLRKKGLERVKKFSWEISVKKICRSVQNLLRGEAVTIKGRL